MAARAADWSEHDLAHRFRLGPAPDELSQLGETLDHLLDRVAMTIRSEQRLTSELAHGPRTPLTAIQGSATSG
jgi:signal transduction histidine kinase